MTETGYNAEVEELMDKNARAVYIGNFTPDTEAGIAMPSAVMDCVDQVSQRAVALDSMTALANLVRDRSVEQAVAFYSALVISAKFPNLAGWLLEDIQGTLTAQSAEVAAATAAKVYELAQEDGKL